MLYSHTIKLVRYYEGADGLKTGHTDAAGYCLAATAKKNDLRLIGIVLGEENSKVRNSEAMTLLDYGFNNVKLNLLKKSGEVIKEVKLEKANQEKISIILKDNLGVVEDLESTTHKYHYDIQLEDMKLPLKKGSTVGKIVVQEKNKNLSTGTLIVKENIKPLSYLKLLLNGFKDIASGEV